MSVMIWRAVESAERCGKNGHNPKSTPSTHVQIIITSTPVAGSELPDSKSVEYNLYTWDGAGMCLEKQ